MSHVKYDRDRRPTEVFTALFGAKAREIVELAVEVPPTRVVETVWDLENEDKQKADIVRTYRHRE